MARRIRKRKEVMGVGNRHIGRVTIPYGYVSRDYQSDLFRCVGSGDGQLRRVVLLWHRRAGKDKTGWNFLIREAFRRVGTYIYVFPTRIQSKKVIWYGMDYEGFRFIDHIPSELIRKVHETELRIELVNGSIIMIGGVDNDSINTWIGTNPIGVVFSEYALMDPRGWDFIRPILTENRGWALFIYTPRGHNHGYDLWEMAVQNTEWYSSRLTVDDTKRENGEPVVRPEDIESERRAGMDEDLIQQEYYCSFACGAQGSYYGELIEAAEKEGRIGEVPHDPGLLVHTSWDIGTGDATGIWFWQNKGLWRHYINYYEGVGAQVGQYIRYLKKLEVERDYLYGKHYVPHDIKVKDWGAEAGTRLASAKRLGVDLTPVPKHSREDRIDAVRATLPMCKFDAGNCNQGIKALRNYQKEYDERRKVFKLTPLHDWSSDGADSFGYGVVGQKPELAGKPRRSNVQRNSMAWMA